MMKDRRWLEDRGLLLFLEQMDGEPFKRQYCLSYCFLFS
jgi:hypothetical protein